MVLLRNLLQELHGGARLPGAYTVIVQVASEANRRLGAVPRNVIGGRLEILWHGRLHARLPFGKLNHVK